MAKSALFPGSFDPFTIGHYSVVERALNMFDRVVIGVGINSNKNNLFSIDQRLEYINSVFLDMSDRVEAVSYQGLTVNYCLQNDLQFIIRGIRNSRDFIFENEIAGMNHTLSREVETVFLASHPEHAVINATIVREILRNGGDVSKFIPLGTTLPNHSK
jgi:pantetheine-phosphate adenylyltransferase